MAGLGDLRFLLEARYQLDEASPDERSSLLEQFDAGVDAISQTTGYGRHQILLALKAAYPKYRAQKQSPELRARGRN